MFHILFLLFTHLNSFEDKFTARGIFVTVEYRADEVRGSIRYSFRFLNFTDLFEIYKIPFYLLDDIRNFHPQTSFRLKIYGQNFYIFKYIKFSLKEKSDFVQSEENIDKTPLDYEPDFVENYLKIFKGDIRFHLIDITFRTLINDYSKLPTSQRKAFISDLDFVLRKKFAE